MADIKRLIPHILKWEGGFANDPADLGGATYRGITLATYEAYCRKKGYPRPTVERLKNMPMEQWEDILKTMYWDKWKADAIRSQSVANMLVDWLWGSGIYAIKIPQQMLGVSVDGIVGPKTIEAVNRRNPREFFDALKAERGAYYERICVSRPANRKFLKGWLNRLNSLKWED